MKNRKTHVAYEFATRMLNTHSVFWLSGRSSDTLQDWANRASYKIDPELYKVSLKTHQTTLRDWLMRKESGKWILIIDDLCIESVLKDFVPSPVPWGKVIITTRQDAVEIDLPLEKFCLPPLSQAEALSLFWSSSPMSTGFRTSDASSTHPGLPLIEELRDEPAAIMFAASCMVSASPASMQSHLETLEEENGLVGHAKSAKTLKWVSIALEELSSVELSVLTQLYLFDAQKISLEAIDVILAPSRSRFASRDDPFIQRQTLRRALESLHSRKLVQREHDPWTSYYSLPRVVEESLQRKLAGDPEQLQKAVETADFLISNAFGTRRLNSVSEFRKFISTIERHYHALSLTSRETLVNNDVEMDGLEEAMGLYYVLEGIEEGLRRSLKQSWRRWNLQNRYELSQSSAVTTEEDRSGLPDSDPTQTWFGLRSRSDNIENTQAYLSISQHIKDALWKSLRDSITVAIIGSGWHGIREDIFDYIRQNSSSRNEIEVSAIIDFVDKGGCEGLIQAVKSYVHGDAFKDEMMSIAGADVTHDLACLVYYALEDSPLGLDYVSVGGTINGALEFLMYSTFIEISRSFDPMLMSMKAFLKTTLEAPLKGSSPDSFEKVVSFFTSYMSASSVETHALSVGRAFWDVLSSAQIWLAVAIVGHVGFAAMTSPIPAHTHDLVFAQCGPVQAEESDEPRLRHQRLAALNHRCVELIREGIMASHTRSTPAWRLSMRKTTYWCLLAEEEGRLWLDDDIVGCEYTNQERWEETCIFLGMTDPVWPLS